MKSYRALLLSFCLASAGVLSKTNLPKRFEGISAPMAAGKHEREAVDTSVRTSKDIRCILEDRSGTFWFATDGDGVCRYDGKAVSYLTEKEGLCSNYVWRIQEGKSGNIWFETRDGVCRYNGKSFAVFADREGLHEEAYAGGAGISSSESLWFGARDGAYHYDGKLFTFFRIPLNEADSKLRTSQPGYNLTAYSVYSVLEDAKGNLWFGTEQRGVCHYDGTSFTYLDGKGLGYAVRSVFRDKNGTLWFGNNGSGLFRYDGNALTNVTAEQGLSNPDFAKTLNGKPGTLARVWSITEDKNGDLWIGTIDAGAWRYNGKSFTNYTVKDGLPGNSINTIYKDRTGRLWFGTGGGGVCTYDGTTFTRFALKAPVR